MLNEDGGVIDDLIVYYMSETGFGWSSTRRRATKTLPGFDSMLRLST